MPTAREMNEEILKFFFHNVNNLNGIDVLKTWSFEKIIVLF